MNNKKVLLYMRFFCYYLQMVCTFQQDVFPLGQIFHSLEILYKETDNSIEIAYLIRKNL